MSKYSAFIIIIALRLFYQPAPGPSSFAVVSSPPAKLLSFKGSLQHQKVILQWSVNENQSTDQFVIEKTEDGKNFKVAALAFGSDTPGTFEYKFYEKAGNQRTQYRIKMINKDLKIEYSDIITIDPVVRQS